MPNYFDQFDASPARKAPSSNFFDQFDEDVTPVDQTKERQALQEELNRRLELADQAGRELKTAENVASFSRPVLRGSVDLADGVLSLPRLAASVPVAAYNAVTGSDVELPISQSVADLSPGAREILAAHTDAERYGSTITRGVGGVIAGLGVGSVLGATGGTASTAANVGRVLASNPGLQATGAVTGGISAEYARDLGYGTVGQTVAGLAGGIAPSLITPAAQAATRAFVRGGEQGRQQLANNLEAFKRAGTTPSVGQATEGRGARATENFLASSPGGAGKIVQKAEAQATELAANIENKAAGLAGRTSAEIAGRKVSASIQGSFLPNFRAQKDALYNKLDAFIPSNTQVGISNTQAALGELTKVTPGAAATTARLVNPRIKQIAQDLATDAQNGTVPYNALKALRTTIGQEMDSGLVTDVPTKQWKALYAALSEDMKAAANQAGPKAKAAWERANNYTSAGYKRLSLLDEVAAKGAKPEEVFKAATSGTAEGATRLRAVMQSIDEDAQKAVAATVLRRMGRAVNSQQDDIGEKFSTETFLTNWNKMSPEAKSTLFNRFGGQFRRDVDAISKVASNLRDGSKVYRNTSGTASAALRNQTVGALALAVLTGQAKIAAGITAGIAGSNVAARLMTNPKFVRWLAESTTVPKSALASQINALAQTAREDQDDELLEGVRMMREIEKEN